ncbi:MAG: hypothetical protein AAGF11_14395 [Myxococcota bacterium]
MHRSLVVRSPVLSLALSLALAGCSSSGSETPKPSPAAAASPSPAAANVATPEADAPAKEDTKAATAEPADAKATAPEPTEPPDKAAAAPKSAGLLHIVAERVGPIELAQWGDEAILSLEGEPLALVDGVPTRRTKGGSGLPPRDWLSMESPRFTFGGDPQTPGGAWITSTQHFDRSASVYTVYERVAQGWRALDLHKGPLAAYYSSYVEHEGALLGLRAWASDPQQDVFEWDDQSPRAKKYRKAVERALTRAKPAWVHLAGAKVESPKIPKGVYPRYAVATDDRALHALARVEHEDESRLVMLVWPQGSTEATTVELPGALDESSEPTLATSGSWALLWGLARDEQGEQQSYLAVGRGTTWEQVEVKPPDHSDDGPKTIVGAAKTPKGELWIAKNDPWGSEGHGPLIWRKPVDKPWQEVPYPETDAVPTSRAKRWVHRSLEHGGLWAQVEPKAVDLRSSAHPTGLVWGAGAVWIVLDVGEAYVGEDIHFERTLLLTTKAADHTVIELPSASKIEIERHNERAKTRKVGDSGCDQPSLLLGSVPKQEQDTIADKVLSIESVGPIHQVYVGTLDGTEVLAAATGVDAEDAPAMHKAVAKTTGRPVQIDCRIPALVRMVMAKER